jgi:hypothetical protein
MFNTENIKRPKGSITITAKNKSGYVKEILYENIIVDEFGKFLSLCCLDPTELNSGINWIAFGTGAVGWDSASPPPASVTDTDLEAEVCRKHRESGDGFQYLDPTDKVSVSVTPTRVCKIHWLFDYDEGNDFPFMELGMYANSSALADYRLSYFDDTTATTDATVIASSNLKGVLVNKKNFPVFTKTSDWQLDVAYRIVYGG